MYLALYRKYRPKSFSDVVGQEHISTTLKRQVASGRLSHAYLFVGTRGTGKTTCAKVLSRAVNCLNPVDGEPCNECASCRGIESESVLDVLEIDAASNNGVDFVRALREEANYVPAAVSKRVYIIDEVHMLSNQAFNALLKTLEEPPEHVLFILATTEIQKVPATILSRCQRFSFKRISAAAIQQRIAEVAEQEGLNLAQDAAERLASLADGSMRDALSLLDQCASDSNIDLRRIQDVLGITGSMELIRLADTVVSGNAAESFALLEALYNDGKDMVALLGELATVIRDVLMYKLSPVSPLLSGVFSGGDISALSAKLTSQQALEHLDKLHEAGKGLSRGGSARLAVEMCVFRMCCVRDEDAGTRAEANAGINATAKAAANTTVAPAPAPVAPTPPTAEPDLPTPEPPPALPGDEWSAIVELLRSDPSKHSILSDSAKVGATIDGDNVTVNANNKFVANLMKNDEYKTSIEAAARKALGRDVTVSINSLDGEDEQERIKKINSLGRFDVTTFE